LTYFVFRLVPLQAAYEWRFDVFFKYLPSILTGLKFTLLVMAGSMVLSVGIGLVAGLMRLSSQPILRLPATVYVDFFRTTPLLIQIVWVFYALPVLLGLGLDALSSGIIALSLNYGAFFAEVFKAGIVSLGKGQFEAG
jgi:polar amino acid transport system permease protein